MLDKESQTFLDKFLMNFINPNMKPSKHKEQEEKILCKKDPNIYQSKEDDNAFVE